MLSYRFYALLWNEQNYLIMMTKMNESESNLINDLIDGGDIGLVGSRFTNTCAMTQRNWFI